MARLEKELATAKTILEIQGKGNSTPNLEHSTIVEWTSGSGAAQGRA